MVPIKIFKFQPYFIKYMYFLNKHYWERENFKCFKTFYFYETSIFENPFQKSQIKNSFSAGGLGFKWQIMSANFDRFFYHWKYIEKNEEYIYICGSLIVGIIHLKKFLLSITIYFSKKNYKVIFYTSIFSPGFITSFLFASNVYSKGSLL